MQEHEFWWELRRLINSRVVIEGSTHSRLGYCDWFETRRSVYGAVNSRIDGRVGFVNGQAASEWNFTLVLFPGTESEKQIEWRKLLPDPTAEYWLKFDDFSETLTITPNVAQPPLK